MKFPRRFEAPALLLTAFFLTGSVRAGDWPRWRGPENTGYIPAGERIPDRLPADAKPLWRVPLGEGVASPVVARGRVFCLEKKDSKEMVFAVDATSGRRLWSVALDDSFEDTQGIGPRCTPTVDGDRLWAQSRKGELKCFATADGTLLWRKNFVTDFAAPFTGETGLAAGADRHGYNGAPIVDGENLIVLAGGTNGASVVCLKKATGALVWKSQSDPAAYAPPIIVTIGGIRQIVAFMVTGLIGVDIKDGRLLWQVPLKTKFGRHVTTPTVVDDIVMVASHEFGLVGVKVSSDGKNQKAEQIWTNKTAAINFSSPVTVGKHLYGLGPAKNLICVEAATGKIAWSKDGVITSGAGKAHAGFLVAGKNLLALTDGGQLVQFSAAADAFKEVSRTQVCGFNWCNPAYADGKLYLRDAKDLACVNLLP
ncbi:MAG: PQQ-binding-like beta-propeller repeat protein [Verrucomicrobia bacterium]|nr:PQQ-binding-like beta-propeller repeat protein [Verrucomicrobiota bacterium]